MKIDGREIARGVLGKLKMHADKLKQQGITPRLAIILVGSDPSSIAYINQKELRAEDVGIQTTTYSLDASIQNSELIELIKKLNEDKAVHGIIVQRPLPNQINKEEVSLAVSPEKDVDGFNLKSQFQMPIVSAVMKILEEIGMREMDLKSKRIVILGKGEAGGKPVINAFQKMGIRPTVIDSKTENPQNITKTADIIICAVGKPNILRPDMIRRGVILISIGISRGESAKLMGDYDQNRIKDVASFYTPTPGGVGPVNVAMLLKNLIFAAKACLE